MPEHDIKLMVTLVVFIAQVTGADAIPSRSSFPLKKIDRSDADQGTRICSFLPISRLYHSCSRRCWEPLALLAPVSSAMYLPSQGEARSWEALGASDPKLPFFSCSGKTQVDVWLYETCGFCSGAVEGQLGAYSTRLSCSSGAATAGLFPSHIHMLEVSEL